jgi:hypothetical protein
VTDAREKYTVRSRHDTTRAAALAPAPAPHHLRAVVFEAGRPAGRAGRTIARQQRLASIVFIFLTRRTAMSPDDGDRE